MQAVPMILTAGAKLVGGIAANKAGQANKRTLYAQAREEEMAGAQQELAIRAEATRAIGAQRAALASNGFAGDTGSALDYLAESQVNAALDAMRVRREAGQRAAGNRAQGDQEASKGKFALIEGLLGAGAAYSGYKSDWAAANAGRGAPKPKSAPQPDGTIVVTRGR